jgi:hypothetical protein
MNETVFGKIKEVRFGIVGDIFMGICLSFGSDADGAGWAVDWSKGFHDFNRNPHSQYCKWTPESNNENCVGVMKYISDLLNDAKVSDVYQLKGKPVEVVFENNCIKSWRLLKEVI